VIDPSSGNVFVVSADTIQEFTIDGAVVDNGFQENAEFDSLGITGYAGGLARKKALLELEESADKRDERLF